MLLKFLDLYTEIHSKHQSKEVDQNMDYVATSHLACSSYLQQINYKQSTTNEYHATNYLLVGSSEIGNIYVTRSEMC